MDIYAEQLVKKIASNSDKVKKSCVFIAAAVISLIIIYIAFIFSSYYIFPAVIASGAVIFCAYLIAGNFNIEYEYSVTNGQFDIDKIINQKSRKPFFNVNVNEFSDIGKITESMNVFDESYTVIMACDGSETGYWYADFTTGKYGKTRLIFSPNEKILNAIKPFLPSTLKSKFVSLNKQ